MQCRVAPVRFGCGSCVERFKRFRFRFGRFLGGKGFSDRLCVSVQFKGMPRFWFRSGKGAKGLLDPRSKVSQRMSMKALTSLNKEVRPFFLSDDSIWGLPSVSSLSDYSIWRSWGVF